MLLDPNEHSKERSRAIFQNIFVDALQKVVRESHPASKAKMGSVNTLFECVSKLFEVLTSLLLEPLESLLRDVCSPDSHLGA